MGEEVILNERYADSIIKNPADYDGIEIHGVRNLNAPGDPAGTMCEVDDETPEFFSAYAHCVQGGVECIGDFGTAEMAAQYGQEIGQKYGWPVTNYADERQEAVTGKVLVVIPSDENDGCSLLFIAPAGMSVADANRDATAAVANANDDNGERSDEVIGYLDARGFDCLGNPFDAKVPDGIAAVTVTAPLYPVPMLDNKLKARAKGMMP